MVGIPRVVYARYTLGGICPGGICQVYPRWCMPRCICPGTPPWVHLRYTRCRTRYHGNTCRHSLTALIRVVTELTVRDSPLTVRHPFHCWAMLKRETVRRRVSCILWEDEGHAAQTALPLSHPFHCWRMFRTSLILNFPSVMRDPWGYTRGGGRSRTVLAPM